MLTTPARERPFISLLIKTGLCIWIGLMIFVYSVRFCPSELDPILSGLGIQNHFQHLQRWLQLVFDARYQSP
jgi:hypothetical protein